MKPTISIQGEQKESLIKTTEALIDKINREIPMLKKSITEVPNVHLANEVSYHFASVPLLLRLSLLDLCILFKLYLESNSDTEQNMLIRLICGQLYEFTEDVPTLFGKKYRELLSNFPNSGDLIKDLNGNVTKEFNLAKLRHVDFLKIIRHNVSHHKDIDALWQYYLINNIDFNWGIKAYIDFTQWYVSHYSTFELKLIDIAMKAQAATKNDC
ncbi:hypothetical protein [Adhaeribacter pallidiroseus]|nr:hypothetical protein [Adhaeribacter pallidiroseus]